MLTVAAVLALGLNKNFVLATFYKLNGSFFLLYNFKFFISNEGKFRKTYFLHGTRKLISGLADT